MITLLIKKNLKECISSIKLFFIPYLVIGSGLLFILRKNGLFSPDENYSYILIANLPYFNSIIFMSILNIDYYSNNIGGNSAMENLPITKKDYLISRYVLIILYCLINLICLFVLSYIINNNVRFGLESKFNMNIVLIFLNVLSFLMLQMSVSAFFAYSVSPKGGEMCAYTMFIIYALMVRSFIQSMAKFRLKGTMIFVFIAILIYWQSYELSSTTFENADFKGGEIDYE